MTTGTDTLTAFSANNDTVNGALTTVSSLDSMVDASTTDTDTANLEISQDLASTFTTTNIEVINLTAYGAKSVDMTKMTGVETFNVKNSTGAVTLNNANSATMALSFEGSSTNSIIANYKAGTLSGTADKLTLSLNTSSAVSIDADAGFESAEITVNGTSDIDAWTAPGVVTAVLKGSGNLDIATGLMTGIETLSASDYTGNLTTGSVVAATGFIDGTITGSSAGTVMTLGSGTDNIGVIDASAATKSTTVKLGAGDDKLVMNAAGTAMYVFGEAGNDSIKAITTALDTADVIDGGAGTDTLTLDSALANNAMVLKSIENVTILATVGGGLTQTFTNDDDATAITAKVDNTAVDLNDLSAGSTVSVVTNTGAATSTASGVAVEYKTQTASATIDITSGMTGVLETEKITDVTVNLGAASNIASDYSFINAEKVTINATGALSTTAGKNIVDGTGTDTLTTVTVTGTNLVKLGTVTATVLDSVNLTAATALTVGNIGADSTKLSTVTLTATAGALSTGHIGKSTNTDVLSVDLNAKDAIAGTNSIISTKIGTVTMDSTDSTITFGAIGSDATEIGDITINAKGDVAVGLIGNATPTSTAGTISMTSTTGKVDFDHIDLKDTTGITVNLTAKTKIDSDGSGTVATVENTDGNITATVAGEAAAVVNFIAIASADNNNIVNLTATNTGGLTSTVKSAGTAGNAETSTISLGNATSSVSNAITLDGIVDTVNVTGGTGTDTIAFGSADAIKNGTISLGGGSSDAIDFTGLAIANSKGLAMNFSSSTITFGAGYANETSVASGKVAAYDAANYAGSTTASAKAVVADGQNFTVSGVEIITGTGVADYISVANTGMTVTGGAGADVIILSSGVDTVKHAGNATDGIDTISNFTVASDFLDINSTLVSTAGGKNTTNADITYAASTIEDVAADASALTNSTAVIWFSAEQLTTTMAANTTAEIVTEAVTQLADGGTDFSANFTAGEGGLILMDDGIDSYVFEYKAAGTATTTEAGEITLIAVLTGITDAGTLTAVEFI